MDIKDTVFELTGFSFNGNIAEKDGVAGVHVKFDGKNAQIAYGTPVQRARCFFLLAQHAADGAFEINEQPAFETVGPMLDMSRARVLTVAGVKRVIDVIAALGMNMLMLYTEDVYEIEGRPFFGYLRGRYTQAELREIDDYAFSLGIEVIPCIQTFGHLEKYLRWAEAAEIKDTKNVVLAGAPETYKFIEDEIKAMRDAFRSDRIHLGMDETGNLGLGEYLKKNGYKPSPEIYVEHLARVLEIARKYYKEPMIWSDMLFNDGSRSYGADYEPPQSRIDATPKDVGLVFWSYSEKTAYDAVIKRHKKFGNDVIFAGGLWTWNGPIPYFEYSLIASKPALEACIANGVKTVIDTVWVSGNCGADFFQALPGLAIFSEYCYKGAACTDEDIYRAAKTIGGVDKELFYATGAPFLGERGAVSFAMSLLYVDPLINLINRDRDLFEAERLILEAKAVFERRTDYKYHRFYELICSITAAKAGIHARIRDAYKDGDREYLAGLCGKVLPAMLEDFNEYYALFKKYWRENYKAFGMEMYAVDIGGAIQRIKDAIEIIGDYVGGRTDRIEELEPEILSGINRTWQTPQQHMSTFRM